MPSADRIAELIAEGQAAERASQANAARDAYERALALLEPSEGHRASELFRAVGRTFFEDGDVEAAEDCLQLALAVAQAHDDLPQIAHGYNSLAVTAFNRGETGEAVPLFLRSREIAEQIGNRELLAMIDQNLGAIAALRGDSEGALASYRKSLDSYRALGLESRAGPLLCNVGRLETELGRAEEARATLEEAFAACVSAGDLHHQILATINQAAAAIATGSLDEAEAFCATAKCQIDDAPRWKPLLYKHMGVLAHQKGDTKQALEHLLWGRELATARQDVVLQGEVAAELAKIYLSQERNRETLDALFSAHAVFKKVQADQALADIDVRLAEFEAVFLGIVQEWGESIDAKDPYTQGHCTRVAEYSLALAESVGIDPKVMIWFQMGALLHDVGKVLVPDEILNKPGDLDEEERQIINRHPEAGETLLKGVDFPWDILPMVRHHHERWDGQGYPDGLSGEDIPLPARIVCVADVFDALTTSRAYRAALSLEEAMSLMEKESGGAFDPQLQALFVELVEMGVIAGHLQESMQPA